MLGDGSGKKEPTEAVVTMTSPSLSPSSEDSGFQEGAKLSFAQRYFTKPVILLSYRGKHDATTLESRQRRFSFRSKGCLSIIAIFSLMTIAIICAVVATLLRQGAPRPTHNGPAPFATALVANFPDPAVYEYNGTWYAFATNNAAGVLHQPDNSTMRDYGKMNIQLATSTDFQTWTMHNYTDDPLPILGDWVAEGLTTDKNITDPGSTATASTHSPSATKMATTTSSGSSATKTDTTATPTSTSAKIGRRHSVNRREEDMSKKKVALPLANVWAPDLIQRPSDGKHIMYYSATAKHGPRNHCIGAAVSNTSSPAGPYAPLNTPIACPIEKGGAIDPAPFIDEAQGDDDADKKDDSKLATMYLLYKVDGNNKGNGGLCGNTVPPLANTPIMLQKLQDDGVTPDGEPVTIMDRTAEDGPLVEAPALMKTDNGTYVLFFSSGCTRSPSYNVKYATATNITGPYTRAPKPLLVTGDWKLQAPGSVSVRKDDARGWIMAFHGRMSVSGLGAVRAMYTTGLNVTTAGLVGLA